MKHTMLALLSLISASMLYAQQNTPLYLLFNASCMDQLEYRQVYAGTTMMGYSVHPTANEQYILMAGSGGINSPTLPKNTVNCREYALNEQFLNDVNSVSRQVYIVHQLTKGYMLTPVIAATQVLRSGTYYLFRAPNYSFAVDTSNLVYESNIATGSSEWYIYFNGLKIRGCYYEYSFKREPTKINQERSEFDFIPGVGIISERTGMTAADAEANHTRLIRVNGMALEDYISNKCQTTATAPGTTPLSKYTPQVNYGAMPVRENDKELGSLQHNAGTTGMVGPPPLANCPDQPGEGYHIVQPGETLNAISRAYEVSLKSLVSWNKIKDPDKILVCQKVWLRKPPADAGNLAYKGVASTPATYSTPSGQTVVRQEVYWQNRPIATQPSTYTYTQPQTYTTTPQPYTAPAQTLVHTVQKGETLYGISQRYGLPESEMRRINNLPATGDVLLRTGAQLFVTDCCPGNSPSTYYDPAAKTYPDLNSQTQPQQPQYNQPQYNTQPAGNTFMPELYNNPTTGQPQYTTPATYNTQPQPVATQPAPATTPAQPTKQPTYFQEYIVREGDTINAIAIKFKVNAQELALVNNKEPNETLIAGQRLLIPRN